MDEMNRQQDPQSQGSSRQAGNQRDADRDGEQQQPPKQWDGRERRYGGERRSDYPGMKMNEGSSR